MTGDDLLDDDFPRIESAAIVAMQPADPILFDVEALLPADDAPILVFGPPASLKSWIAKHLCDVMVTGKPFLGRYAVRRRDCALYVNLDAGAKTFRNRVRRLSDAKGFDFVSLAAVEFNFAVLRGLMARYRGGFVVLDCLSAIYNPDRAKDPAFAMREFVDDLRALYAEYDCGGAVIDHPHRPKERGELGDYHGSIQKEAAFRGMWAIAAEPADGASATRRTTISCRKLSEGQPFSPVHTVIDFSGDRVTFALASHDPAAAQDELEGRILAWGRMQPYGFTKTAAEKAVAGRATDIRNAVDRLVIDGEITPTGAKRGTGTLYEVPTPSASGTGWDGLDGLDPDARNDTPSPYSPSIGDGVSGTGSRTGSVVR